ncbi:MULTISPECIES: histone deacetylase [unclassified Synechocystis]|uniref:histone deacetylase family protein n=1 Tax=unclassified Synechocystis TaxID=2640012 RepID=UPI000421A2F4|nr:MULTISPECIES: histone deacetylase [unclassified Synechocystis]AIE72947.1 Acetylspermidine deacetylase [Synechocystis sp. PCC 6714]MCT0252576.1 histone deacetylase [Synechocystis sp. CS-94]
MVAIIYSAEFLHHDTGPTHPECPARLTAIASALRQMPGANYLHWQRPSLDQPGLDQYILQCHSQGYLSELAKLAQSGGGSLDADTPVSPQSYDVARLAVQAWLDGVDHCLNQRESAFVLARPPGHHAERDRGMGFCLLNNAAIAAHYALTKPGINRVAILDWDVHHGNGTEALVENNPQIFYCSLHQFPCYPGTGQAGDRGKYNNVLNLPLAPGGGGKVYQRAFADQVLPFLRQVKPDLLLVSAGYDANQADPLAYMNLTPKDYAMMSRHLLEICPYLLLGLEGGYHLPSLAQSVTETIKPLLS